MIYSCEINLIRGLSEFSMSSVMQQRAVQAPFRPRLARVIFGVLFTLIGLGLLATSFNWILDGFRGPLALSLDQLYDLKDPYKELSQGYVTFKHEGITDTGVILVMTKRGEYIKTEAKYVLLKVKDKYIMGMLKPSEQGSTVRGTLHRSTKDSTMIDEKLLAAYFKKNPKLSSSLLPYELHGSVDQTELTMILLCMCGFMLAMGIGFLGYEWYQRSQLAKFKRALAKRLGENSRYVFQG